MSKDLKALNDVLHRTLAMLADPEITEEQLKLEVERSKAITSVAKDIVSVNRLVLDASVASDKFISYKKLPKMLQVTEAPMELSHG